MPEKRYCIICGKEIQSDDPDVVFCPAHGGPSHIETPLTQPKETTWEAEEGEAQPVRDVAASWQPGQTLLDTYEVLGKLGEGGMGLVYRVHHNSWNMDLAVKQPKASLFATQKGKEGFIREAETWVDLGLHPHITSCYYVRSIDDIPHIFVEFMEGGSLEDWIQQKKHDIYEGGPEASLERILDIAIQFAWGLAYAHEQGLVHQDVKPLNVLMTPDGVVKVTDFGLAKARAKAGESANGREKRALVSGSLHTEAYRSPEQAKGEMLSHKTDTWSWAVSVLEIFEGGVYWYDGQSAAISLETYLKREGEAHLPAMPSNLVVLLRQCFQVDPDDRPDAMQIAEILINTYQQNIGQAYPRELPKAADLRADSLNNKALSLMDLGRVNDAHETWENALAINPNHVEVTYNQALSKWLLGELTDQQVIDRLTALTHADDATFLPSFFLGQIHAIRGDIISARQAYEEALKISSENTLIQDEITHLNQMHSINCLKVLHGHTDEIREIAVTADGRVCVSGSWKDELHIWDIEQFSCLAVIEAHTPLIITPDDTKLIAKLPDHVLGVWNLADHNLIFSLEGHTDQINCLAVTPDSKLLVSAGWDHSIRVWDLQNGTPVHMIEHGYDDDFVDLIGLMNFDSNPMGKYIASPDNDNMLIWEDDNPIGSRNTSGRKSDIVHNLEISPDGKLVASITGGTGIQIWDLENGDWQNGCDGYSGLVRFTPDGKKLVTAGDHDELWVWDIDSCERMAFEGHAGEITALDITPNGKRIVSGSSDKTLQIWDIECEYGSIKLRGHMNTIETLAVEPEGKYVVSGSADNTLRIWDLENGQCLRTLQGHTKRVNSLVITSDGERVISGSDDTTLRIWQMPRLDAKPVEWSLSKPVSLHAILRSVETVRRKLDQAKIDFEKGKYTSTAQTLKAVFAIKGYENDPEALNLWHATGIKAGKPDGLRMVYLQMILKHKSSIFDVAITRDGKYAVSACADKKLRLWDLGNGKLLRELEGHTRSVSSLALSVDGRLCVSGSHDYTLRIWNLFTGSCLHVLKSHLGGIVKSVEITQDEKLIISSSGSNLFIWDLQRGDDKGVLFGHKDWVTTFVSIPGSSLLVSGSRDKTLRVWDLVEKTCCFVLEGHLQGISTLVITPDCKNIISGSGDNTMRVWDIHKGRCIRVLEGHQSDISAIVITPDGKKVISSSKDRTIRVWSLESGKCLNVLKGHTRKVTSLVLTPQKNFVVSGSLDSSVRLWDLEKFSCMDTLQGHYDDGILGLSISPDGRRIIARSEFALRVWNLNWDYNFPGSVPWHDGALPNLEVFINRHTQEKKGLFTRAQTSWTEADFQRLMIELGYRGYGWLREDGVRRKLEEMAAQRG